MNSASNKATDDKDEVEQNAYFEPVATLPSVCPLLELNERVHAQRLNSEEIQKKLDVADEKHRNCFTEWDRARNDSLRNKNTVEKQKIELESLKENLEQVTNTLLHCKTQSETRNARMAEYLAAMKHEMIEAVKFMSMKDDQNRLMSVVENNLKKN